MDACQAAAEVQRLPKPMQFDDNQATQHRRQPVRNKAMFFDRLGDSYAISVMELMIVPLL